MRNKLATIVLGTILAIVTISASATSWGSRGNVNVNVNGAASAATSSSSHATVSGNGSAFSGGFATQSSTVNLSSYTNSPGPYPAGIGFSGGATVSTYGSVSTLSETTGSGYADSMADSHGSARASGAGSFRAARRNASGRATGAVAVTGGSWAATSSRYYGNAENGAFNAAGGEFAFNASYTRHAGELDVNATSSTFSDVGSYEASYGYAGGHVSSHAWANADASGSVYTRRHVRHPRSGSSSGCSSRC